MVFCTYTTFAQNNDIAIPDIPASVVLNQDASVFLRNSSLRNFAFSVGQKLITSDQSTPFGFEYNLKKIVKFPMSVSLGTSINDRRNIGFGLKLIPVDEAEVIKDQYFSKLLLALNDFNKKVDTIKKLARMIIVEKYSTNLQGALSEHSSEIDSLSNYILKKEYNGAIESVSNITQDLSWTKTNLSFAVAGSIGSTNTEWKNLDIDSSYRLQTWVTYSMSIAKWFQFQGGGTFLTQSNFNRDTTSGGLNVSSFIGSNDTKASIQLSGRWGNHSPIGKIDINGEFNIGENQWLVLGARWESINHQWIPFVDFRTGISNN